MNTSILLKVALEEAIIFYTIRYVQIVIYANQLLRAAYPSMKSTAMSILKNERAFEADKKIISIKEIINLIKND